MSFVCEKMCIQFVYDGEKKMFVVWLRMCGYYTSTILFCVGTRKKKKSKQKEPTSKSDGIVRNQQNKALHQRRRDGNILL